MYALLRSTVVVLAFASTHGLAAEDAQPGTPVKQLNETGTTAEDHSVATEKPDGSKNIRRFVWFSDFDGDGVNDRFRDADGNGVNDLDGNAYPHRFRFVDKDGDGVNDVFTDEDGDGVNDRDPHRLDQDGDGRCDNVIDADGDGINDITGHNYAAEPVGSDMRPGARRTGMRVSGRFVDEDGDGVNDMTGTRADPAARTEGDRMDVFVDEDGDGICDGRTVRRPMRGRMPGGGHMGGRQRGKPRMGPGMGGGK